MTFYLNILIDVCLIVAIWKVSKRPFKVYFPTRESKFEFLSKRHRGILEKASRRAAVSEKMADRAFQIANAASLGVIALQKSLAIPRALTRPQGIANKLAKKEVDGIFSTQGGFDFMRPYLDDHDLEVIDRLEEEKAKAMNGRTE